MKGMGTAGEIVSLPSCVRNTGLLVAIRQQEK